MTNVALCHAPLCADQRARCVAGLEASAAAAAQTGASYDVSAHLSWQGTRSRKQMSEAA